jgi:ABC-type Fe3+ transport system substrate-binding protein
MRIARTICFLILRSPRSERLKGRGSHGAKKLASPSWFETPASRAPHHEGLAKARNRRAATSLTLVSLFLASASAFARADEASLYAAAKAEGQVVWYTTLIVNQAVRPLVDAFQKKYPGIDVQFNRADSIPTALKIINEGRAGQPQADVFDGIETEPAIAKAGLIEKYVSVHADKYPAEMKDPEGLWIATNLYFLTPGYNTTLVSKEAAPKKLDDLLDPKWKGKMAWSTARSAGGPIFVGAVLKQMGDDAGLAWLKRLARQDVVNTDITARAVLDQVIAGEYPIALSIFNHHAVLSAQKGAPVDWIKLDPIAAPLQVTSLVKGSRHPNAGKLLLDFIASEEGQRVLAASDYLPAMPSVQAKTPTLKPEAGGFKPSYFPPDAFARDGEKWQTTYNELFR